MSALETSSLRLADDLLSSFEEFEGQVHAAAGAYRAAQRSGNENLRLDAAGTFLLTIGEAERRFHQRFIQAAHDSQARDEELTG